MKPSSGRFAAKQEVNRHTENPSTNTEEKPELKVSVNKYGVPFYAHWDEMGWPLPDLTNGDQHSIEWKLRYAQEHLTHEEALGAASIIAAYYHLVMAPISKRNKVAGVLKNLTTLWHKQGAS